jgi:hypothetical protein
MQFTTLMISCRERCSVLEQTLARLAACGWPAPRVVLDDELSADRLVRIQHVWRRAIRAAMDASSRFVLLLEDDLIFGSWFAANLESWEVLARVPDGGAFYASLYNPNRPYRRRVVAERYFVAEPRMVWGSQAVIVTPATARFIDRNWESAAGNPDQRMPLIAARVTPIYFHVPSLVDHAPVPTTWGGIEHRACDFDPEFRAGPA